MIHWSIRTENPSWVLSTIKDDWLLSVLINACLYGYYRFSWLWLQLCLLSTQLWSVSFFSSLYQPPNQAIKPFNPKDPAPPANKPPAYVLLYIISVLTVSILLYLFVIRQCCRVYNRPPKHLLCAMMVLPMNCPGGKRPIKNQRKTRRA